MWWWILVIIVVIAVGITIIGLVVFSAASNRQAWKDNLEDAYYL